MSAAATIPRTAREVCNLNRQQLRAMGLTSGGVMRLYDQARDVSLSEGCKCGVQRILPTPKGDGTYRVDVYHAPGCKAHPLRTKRWAIKRNELRKILRLRGRRDSFMARVRYQKLRFSRWRRGASDEPEE